MFKNLSKKCQLILADIIGGVLGLTIYLLIVKFTKLNFNVLGPIGSLFSL